MGVGRLEGNGTPRGTPGPPGALPVRRVKTMRRAALAGLLASAVLAAGCFVDIVKVDDPRAAFARARAEAGRVQGQPGRPGHLEVLVYDRHDAQLVRASLPMWLVNKIDDEGELDLDLDGEGGQAAAKLKGHLRLKDLEKAGRGILVEAEEEDGDQVLVWLR